MENLSENAMFGVAQKSLLRPFTYERIITFLLFLTIFLVFVTPPMDNDMPWHLKTGEYLLANMHLPSIDPFSYAKTEVSTLGHFILTQYWLAQILFWVVYSIFGVHGIVLLIASIFTLIAYLLFSMIRRKNYFLALFATGCYLVYFLYGFNTLRPQIFTFLFSTLTIYFVQKFKETCHIRYLVLLPIMFLLWANMHGGFIFGIVILSIYLVSDFISLVFPSYSTDQVTGNSLKKLLFAVILSLGLCYFNPNSYDAFGYALRTHATPIFTDIMEYKSPLQFDSLFPMQLLKFWLTIPLSLTVFILALMRRKVWSSLVVILTIGMSFTAIRYFPLLIIVTTAAIGQISSKFDFVLLKMKAMTIYPVSIVMLLSCIGYFSNKIDINTFDLSLSPFNPAKAISFLKENHISGNIYGSYNKSGHLILELYPESKVFWSSNFISSERYNDGNIIGGKELGKRLHRALYSKFSKDIGIIIGDSLTRDDITKYDTWIKKINDSRTEIIIHEAMHTVSGQPIPLVFLLLQREDWKLIYADGEVVIFLKNIKKYQDKISALIKPNTIIYDQMIAEGIRGWASGNANFPAIAALGYLLKGDSGKYTEEIIRNARESDPNNIYAIVDDRILKKMNSLKEESLKKDLH